MLRGARPGQQPSITPKAGAYQPKHPSFTPKAWPTGGIRREPTGGQRARSCSKATPSFTPKAWRVPAQGSALGKDPKNNSCALQGRSLASTNERRPIISTPTAEGLNRYLCGIVLDLGDEIERACRPCRAAWRRGWFPQGVALGWYPSRL
ncbi:MAG TPA: hypothetical protein VFE51_02170, partial [Verrucomicrobiae bacterium]|nr:hypothetical protein [Verrucomicrobiae bacterium]